MMTQQNRGQGYLVALRHKFEEYTPNPRGNNSNKRKQIMLKQGELTLGPT